MKKYITSATSTYRYNSGKMVSKDVYEKLNNGGSMANKTVKKQRRHHRRH